jgi:hypothetical protein
MEKLKGPKTYFESEAINLIQKELEENGVLKNHPKEYHEKIINDFLVIGVYIHNMPNEGVVFDEYKSSIPAAYFTLIKFSNYQLDITDFIKAYQQNLKDFMSGDDMWGTMIQAATLINIEDPELIGMVKQIMEVNTLEFLEKYANEKWPNLVENINNLSEEEFKNLLDTNGITKPEDE